MQALSSAGTSSFGMSGVNSHLLLQPAAQPFRTPDQLHQACYHCRSASDKKQISSKELCGKWMFFLLFPELNRRMCCNGRLWYGSGIGTGQPRLLTVCWSAA